MHPRRLLLAGLAAALASLAFAGSAGAYSGQVFFGQVSVEPAVNLADGSAIYLLTPDKAPLPSKANPKAVAPMYLPMYPQSSTIDPAELNCQPTLCDHVPVVPQEAIDGLDTFQPAWELSSVYPEGTVESPFPYVGTQTGGLYEGHDHLVGVPPTGDFNVAWQVELILFTAKGVEEGAANERILTMEELEADLEAGYVIEVKSGIVFNCSKVSEKVYTKHMG